VCFHVGEKYCLRRPLLSGERCRGMHPSSCSFYRCPATDPSHAALVSSWLSCRPLVATCSPVEAMGLTAGPGAVRFPFACTDRGAGAAPDSSPRAGRLAPGSIESTASWLCLGGGLSFLLLLFGDNVRLQLFKTTGDCSPRCALRKVSSSSDVVQRAIGERCAGCR
jgi:hypothetical protein